MTSWRTDIERAPRGHYETRQRKVGSRVTTGPVFVPEYVWLASQCGKVTRSYRIPATVWEPSRWNMFGVHEHPIAWREYIEGEFPRVMVDKEATYPNGPRPDYPEMEAVA